MKTYNRPKVAIECYHVINPILSVSSNELKGVKESKIIPLYAR